MSNNPMRSYLTLLITLLLTITITQAQSGNCSGTQPSRLVIGQQALVTAEGGINLRVFPSATTELINVVAQDAIIPVIDGPFCAEGLAWWQVDYDGDRGWVAEGTSEFYWLAPYVIQQAQIGNIRIEVQPNLISGIEIERLADPLRSQFVLDGFPVASTELTPFIVIFDEAPDDIVLESPETVESNALAQWQSFDEGGVRFVDLYYTGDLSDETVFTLIYHYMALTDDGRFVDAYFPIQAPYQPLIYEQPDTDIAEYNEEFLENTVTELEALSPDLFIPTLAQLDGIVQSLQINAPLTESDVFTFASSGITFDYNPILATGITESLVLESEIPRHIALQFDNYPAEIEATLRVYLTDDVDGATLSNFQQTLSRQPSNPPRIPVLSQPETPLSRTDLTYLRFGNGNGIRYLAEFEEGQSMVSYQGISDSGDYYISLLLPITDDYPPIEVIDNLIASLQVGE